MTNATPHLHPIHVRYAEVDQQGVVFNSHYLVWFDEAMTGLLAARGLPYTEMERRGADVMLVHTELDWMGSVGWGDEVVVAVATAAIGTTSFTLDFEVRRAGEPAVLGRTVYVCVAPGGGGKQPIPDFLRAALEPVSPLR